MKHEKYDTSNVKTITLNGKKYIDMSVIEDIKTEITAWEMSPNAKQYNMGLHRALEIIDRKVNEVNK